MYTSTVQWMETDSCQLDSWKPQKQRDMIFDYNAGQFHLFKGQDENYTFEETTLLLWLAAPENPHFLIRYHQKITERDYTHIIQHIQRVERKWPSKVLMVGILADHLKDIQKNAKKSFSADCWRVVLHLCLRHLGKLRQKNSKIKQYSSGVCRNEEWTCLCSGTIFFPEKKYAAISYSFLFIEPRTRYLNAGKTENYFEALKFPVRLASCSLAVPKSLWPYTIEISASFQKCFKTKIFTSNHLDYKKMIRIKKENQKLKITIILKMHYFLLGWSLLFVGIATDSEKKLLLRSFYQ